MPVPLYAGIAAYQLISGFVQADMVAKQAAIQKQIDEENAKLAEFDAWRMEGYGQTAVAQYQQQIDQAAGAAKVSAAAAGADIRSGSLSEVVAENDMIGVMNQMEIENQAREKALGYTRQARNIRTGSMISQSQAKIQQSSIIGGSILRAGGTVAAGMIKPTTLGTTTTVGAESGYVSTPGSYLTGTSQDLGGTGYLGLP